MVDKLIAPRRGQAITENGILDLRTAIYIEENALQTNESTGLTEADPYTISLESDKINALAKSIKGIENLGELGNKAELNVILKSLQSIEDSALPFNDSKLKSRIEDLENLSNASGSSPSDLEAYKKAVRKFMGPVINSSDKYVPRTTSNFIDSNSNIDEDLLDLDTILNNVKSTFGAAVDSLISYVSRVGTNFINGNSDINEDFLDLDSQIKSNEDDIGTNTTNIGTNTTDISTNSGGITSLNNKFFVPVLSLPCVPSSIISPP